MVLSARLDRGLTRLESLVAVIVIAVLAGLALPVVTDYGSRGALARLVNNARGIHIAAMSMVVDGAKNNDPDLGWPGDLKARGRITSLSDYVNIMVRNGYLKPNDLKIFANRDFKAYKGALSAGGDGVLVPSFKDENSALKVFLVKESDPSNTVFLASKNYTYNKPLNHPNAKPYGDKGFVVVRKGGDGAFLTKARTGSLNLVGALPGGGSVESAENCLNPDLNIP